VKLLFPCLALAAMLLASAAHAETDLQAAANEAVRQAILKADLATAADKAVADAIQRADLQKRADAAVAAALAKAIPAATVAVAPAAIPQTCQCVGCPGNPDTQKAVAPAASTSRFWRVWSDGSRTPCDASGNPLGATAGVCTINADGTTSCGQSLLPAALPPQSYYPLATYSPESYFTSGSSGACAGGSCGQSSGRVGLFGRRR
jgi:hypothetical protein